MLAALTVAGTLSRLLLPRIWTKAKLPRLSVPPELGRLVPPWPLRSSGSSPVTDRFPLGAMLAPLSSTSAPAMLVSPSTRSPSRLRCGRRGRRGSAGCRWSSQSSLSGRCRIRAGHRPRERCGHRGSAVPNPAGPVISKVACLLALPMMLRVALVGWVKAAALTLVAAPSVLLPIWTRPKLPLLNVPPMLSVVPPCPLPLSTRSAPLSERPAVTNPSGRGH